MKLFREIYRFSKSEEGKTRLKIVEFLEQHGLKAALDAYSIPKATLYRWRKMYLEAGKNQLALIPGSRCPKHRRVMRTHLKALNFIREIRQEHYRLGKEKIKPLLDEYCEKQGLKPPKVSTIGKIIKRHNLYFQPAGRVYHNPGGGFARQVKARSKARVKYSPKVKQAGYYEIDTIVRFVNDMRVYVFNAVDVRTRFQFSYGYRSGTSNAAKDFFQKLETVSPFRITKVQTDNGSEYQGEFSEYLKKQKLEQVYIYPRCPKINGYVERANRSLTEEFLVSHLYRYDRYFNINDFNDKIIEHLIWFNSKRVHKSLGNLSPLDFWIKSSAKSHMWVTHTFF
ncbi:MAG: integrase core domain-containing protein [Candidatus Margulisbacteria bacterium]|jgi:transposase InsO family protein|nr:integrase core domain-containing protein [Candidatus Margulisiibacteriota bacterium]